MNHLRFADDSVILFASGSHLQFMIESLPATRVNVGLEINHTKTITMKKSCKITIKIKGNLLEYID